MTNAANIFEHATREKLRFPSVRGLLTVEDLWTLRLTSRDSFDLDHVARGINALLKEVSEESFVATKSNPEKESLSLKLDIVKHIIQVKMDEAAAAVSAADKAERRRKLLLLLDKKQEAELEGLSKEDIQKQLAELA